MHLPKNNLFAYLCTVVIGGILIYLGASGVLAQRLANIILMLVGALVVVTGIITIVRHLREKREPHDDGGAK